MKDKLKSLKLFIKNLKLFKCPSTPWIDKIWYSYIARLFSTERELKIHATIWMNLKNRISEKKNRYKRPYIAWFHLYKMSSKSKRGFLGLGVGTGIDCKSEWTILTDENVLKLIYLWWWLQNLINLLKFIELCILNELYNM